MAVTSIVISDLVPLAERGMYNGMVGLYVSVYALGDRLSLTRMQQDLGHRCCHRSGGRRRPGCRGTVALAVL